MRRFAIFYFRSIYIRDIKQRLKSIVIFLIVFIVAGIFSVLNSISEINRKDFLAGCDFQNILLSDNEAEHSLSCYSASAICTGKNSANQVNIMLFNGTTDEGAPFFGTMNRIQGAFTGNTSTIWLTYNTAYAMSVDVGDKIDLILWDSEERGSLCMKEYIVDGILKPFGGDFTSNVYDDNCGFANVFFTEIDAEKAAEVFAYNLQFDVENNNAVSIGTLFSRSKLMADYLGKSFQIWFPLFSVLLISVLGSLEYHHYHKRNKQRFAILYALGIGRRTLRWIQNCEFAISGLIATLVFIPSLFWIMADLLGKYVPINLVASIACVELMIFLSVYLVCRHIVERCEVGVLFINNRLLQEE